MTLAMLPLLSGIVTNVSGAPSKPAACTQRRCAGLNDSISCGARRLSVTTIGVAFSKAFLSVMTDMLGFRRRKPPFYLPQAFVIDFPVGGPGLAAVVGALPEPLEAVGAD